MTWEKNSNTWLMLRSWDNFIKKIFFFTPIIILIFATTLTKNSTKKLDKQIFEINENIRILEESFELALLDFNILTSPKKLIEYQQFYFEEKFIQKKIENLSTIAIVNDKLKIEKMVNIDEWDKPKFSKFS